MNSTKESAYPLEMTGDQLQQHLEQLAVHLKTLLDNVEHTPVDRSDSASTALIDSLREPLPMAGQPFPEVLQSLFEELIPPSLSPISGGFMGYVPGGGLTYAALADLIAGTVNRYVGARPVAPALSDVEATVIRWFADIVGLPDTAQGFMTSGGSLANQSALTVARVVRCGEDFQRATLYLSDQAHGCLSKAAKLCGFPAKHVRVVPTDHAFRMDVDRLRDMIACDRAQGLEPLLIAANAGSTNTGAIDPLDALADLCQREQLWLHVDAAYGGFFAMTERGGRALKGLSQADSVALDPHKTLFLPYGTGALLVRRGDWLRQTFQAEADYLPQITHDPATMDFRDISPELTRPFRGLRVWLPLKVLGAPAFRDALDEKLNLTEHVYQAIRSHPSLEVLAAPELSIMAFALRPRAEDALVTTNERSVELLKRVNAKNRVHLTGTQLGDRFAIRIAIGVYRTHQIHIDQLLTDVWAAIEELDT